MKLRRQAKIIELVNKSKIETQEDLSELLQNTGFKVTQATISRDIRELRLTKVSENGKQFYRILNQSEGDFSKKYIEMLRNGYIYMEPAQNILVIKTASGMAMAVAAAIDAINIPGIVGCIAGDDTIICVIKTEEEVANVMNRINKLVKSNN